MNSINDQKSLTESVDRKQQDVKTIKISFFWNKRLEVYDYKPEEDGEYQVGDVVGGYTLVVYLAAFEEYEDVFDGILMLFRDSHGSYVVGEASHNHVYKWHLDDFTLTESLLDKLGNKTRL